MKVVKKLSKRDESIIQFIEQYKELGYLPEAIFNFIALLGWSPVGEEEIFSKDEFIKMFDAARLSKSPALFDSQKLKWMNNQYMKKARFRYGCRVKFTAFSESWTCGRNFK